MSILSVNIGSSSLKFALYETAANGIGALLGSGQMDGLQPGGTPQWRWQSGTDAGGGALPCRNTDTPHTDALRVLQQWLAEHFPAAKLHAVAHRVVHGGGVFGGAVVVDEQVLAQLHTFERLAPLHQPYNLAGIARFQAAFAAVPQVACFDTAFHSTLPPQETTFALPEADRAAGIRRYGFHGLSYQYVCAHMLAASPRAHGRMIMLHLGSGSSACATVNGQSTASSMGFTALDGLMMGSRCGSLDAGVLLHWLAEGADAEAIERKLYKESGLLGVSGLSADVRRLRAAADQGHAGARLALQLYSYRVRREIGALAACIGGVDVLVFTAGIGENDAVLRAEVVQSLGWLGMRLDTQANEAAAHGIRAIHAADSSVEVWVCPTDEGRNAAGQAWALLQAGQAQ
ncbi:acetate kinase [Neisseria sp. HSC-16F19]|nr:acetate/propionate family kinase [Neisseria sp. HSC-16F19]MCP2040600.1 acetate kinase [Neisseria sp. HSC-16F19]